MNYKIIIISLFLLYCTFTAVNVFAQENDSLTIHYYIIDSSPQNAEVFINDVPTGETPQRIILKDSSLAKVVIKLKGYLDYSFNISASDSPARKTVTLISSSVNSKKMNLVEENKSHFFNKPRKFIPITISALITAASGISAYYFKSLAIENSDVYSFSGDPASLDRKRKYDIISGVSLGVMELGFSAFLYYLLLDN